LTLPFIQLTSLLPTTNQKRTFGSLLTLLGIIGIIGIIYGVLGFIQIAGLGLSKMNSLVPFFVGLIFFLAGINLVKTTSDRAQRAYHRWPLNGPTHYC